MPGSISLSRTAVNAISHQDDCHLVSFYVVLSSLSVSALLDGRHTRLQITVPINLLWDLWGTTESHKYTSEKVTTKPWSHVLDNVGQFFSHQSPGNTFSDPLKSLSRIDHKDSHFCCWQFSSESPDWIGLSTTEVAALAVYPRNRSQWIWRCLI